MDLENLSRLLKELLFVNDRVSLPGMGSFIAELAPSVFSDRATVIHPPYRRILFRTSEVWNDGLLEGLYGSETGKEPEIVKSEIGHFVREFKNSLNIEKSIRLPGFGTMRATDQKDYFFVADKDLFIYPEGYGLEPLNIKPLTKSGLIELLDEEEPRGSDDDVKARNLLAVQKGKDSPTGKFKASPTGKFKDTALQKINVPATGKSNKPGIKKRSGYLFAKGGRWIRPLLNTFIVIFLIMIAVGLLYIFKDEVRPFWEWLLYSKEEREVFKFLS